MPERMNLRFPSDFEWIVYVRISDDREGAGLGVARQEQECRELVGRLGGRVLKVLVDNDLTANDRSGRYKPRPGYDELPALLRARAGRRGVVAWHTDRLHRTPRELEDFIDLVESTGAAVETVKAGTIDLSTAGGRMTARVHCAVARHESEHKSERIRSKVVQLAAAGQIGNGGPRPFGYTRVYAGEGPRRKIVRDEVNEKEAALIREWAQRLLAGESKYALVKDAQERGIPTSTGKAWTQQAMHYMLRSGRIAGLREHKGRVVGPAQWPAIIDRETHEQLRARLSDYKNGTPRVPRKHHLTGIVCCSLPCGTRMRVSMVHGKPRYECLPKTEGGCAGRAIQLEPLRELVDSYVIARLSDPRLLRDLSAYEADADGVTKRLVDQVEADERRLQALQAALEGGDPDELPEVLAAVRTVRERIRETRSRLAEQVGVPHGLGEAVTADIADRWGSLSVDKKRALVGVVVEKVHIHPAVRGRGRFDPDRVQIVSRRWATDRP
jgi:DNA invertase Pin-like site-specific DNA recombinase